MQAGTFLSEGEKNAALWCSFNLKTLLTSFHAASRAPCSCHSVSSWDRSSNYGALGLRWWGSPGQNVTERGILVSNFGVTRNSLREFYTLNRFCVFKLFRTCLERYTKSRAFDDRRPASPRFNSWQVSRFTTGCPDLSWLSSRLVTSCRVLLCMSYFFNITTAILSSIFLDLLLGYSSTRSWSCKTCILEDATFHKNGCCNFFEGNPCKAIVTFSRWDFYLGLRVLDGFRSFCRMKEFGNGFDGELFPRLFISWRKLHLSLPEHCPLNSHCQQSPTSAKISIS